jgi:hypothetical protein
MAKDPAVLFYTADFLLGTEFFTDEETGQYIKLLCMQHQVGHLPETYVLSRVKSNNSPVLKKFLKDKNGMYYQQRMEEEVQKRLSYSESRRNNRLKGKEGREYIEDVISHMSEDMSDHMVNENENVNNNEKKEEERLLREEKKLGIKLTKSVSFKKPTIEEVREYCQERKNSVDVSKWYDFYESKGWMIGKNHMKDWKAAIRTWERSDVKTEAQTHITYGELLERFNKGETDIWDKYKADKTHLNAKGKPLFKRVK